APPSRNQDHQTLDENLKARIDVTAGPHELGVTFLKNPSSLLETKRQPYQAHYNMHRHPRLAPAIYQVSINGPYDSKSPGDTPSRRRIFGDATENPLNRTSSTLYPPDGVRGEDDARAERILSTLIRRAYRRPVAPADLEKPM